MAGTSDNETGPLALRRSFTDTTSAAHKRAAGNPTAFKALSGIERRTAIVRQRAVDLYQRFEDRWTAKEAIRLWERHLAKAAQYPAPPRSSPAVTPEEVLKIASRNVRARTNRRLSKINDIKTRMANATVRNLGSPSLRASFAEVAPRDKLENTSPKMRRRR